MQFFRHEHIALNDHAIVRPDFQQSPRRQGFPSRLAAPGSQRIGCSHTHRPFLSAPGRPAGERSKENHRPEGRGESTLPRGGSAACEGVKRARRSQGTGRKTSRGSGARRSEGGRTLWRLATMTCEARRLERRSAAPAGGARCGGKGVACSMVGRAPVLHRHSLAMLIGPVPVAARPLPAAGRAARSARRRTHRAAQPSNTSGGLVESSSSTDEQPAASPRTTAPRAPAHRGGE